MTMRSSAAWAALSCPRSLLALPLACSLLTCAPSHAQSSYDPVDDVFYQIMPIAWRDSNNDTNRFGDFGGRYVPEALITALDELERVYEEAKADPEFHRELARLNQQWKL